MPICQSIVLGRTLPGVHSEMVDFGPRQGRTRVFAAGVASATLRTETRGERRIGPKYAIYGWTLNNEGEDHR